eukprot:2225321-Rhodomonas_salina.3
MGIRFRLQYVPVGIIANQNISFNHGSVNAAAKLFGFAFLMKTILAVRISRRKSVDLCGHALTDNRAPDNNNLQVASTSNC